MTIEHEVTEYEKKTLDFIASSERADMVGHAVRHTYAYVSEVFKNTPNAEEKIWLVVYNHIEGNYQHLQIKTTKK